MTLKYTAEASLALATTGRVYAPWEFINPALSIRTRVFQGAPEWVPWALAVWTFPFLWIAVSMSVRRAGDAGISPWNGLAVLIPVVNVVIMIILSVLPSTSREVWQELSTPAPSDPRRFGSIQAVLCGIGAGAATFVASVYLLRDYSTTLFMGAPLVMGATSSYVANRNHPEGIAKSLGIAVLTIAFAELALLLFAIEGALCLFMAAPIMMLTGMAGGLIGKAIAACTRRPGYELSAAIAILPVCAVGESLLPRAASELEVATAVVIDASPLEVWQHVIAFEELTEPPEWYFRLGIACPERARIEGRGVGAVRHCEFTTGSFVEPITVWQPGRRLAFDVTDQPAPMFEMSPYRHVHPPHLDGYLRSNRGEFRLLELPDGRTRLEGRTWYEFDMFPGWYWTAWSDSLIHRIHLRVLRHIRHLAEK
jgi:hypothetical protein